MKKFIFSGLALAFLIPFFSFSDDFSDTKPIASLISTQKISVNKIHLKWMVPDDFNAASIAIFRDKKQISTAAQILSMKPVADVPAKTTSFTDTLSDFGEYFYALVARDKDGNIFDVVVPGTNATLASVKLENPNQNENAKNPIEAQYQPSYLRNLPLPYLDLISDIDRKPFDFSVAAMKDARELSGKYYNSKPKLLEEYVFEEDLLCASSGDDYYLFQSLKNYFIKKDYKSSADDLKRFLSVKREPYTALRATFYLAESEYFSRNYKSALQLFLFLDDIFPELSKYWIDSTLDLYEMPGKS